MKKSLSQIPEFDSATAAGCPINPNACSQLTRRDAVRQIGGWTILAGAIGGITLLGQACGPMTPSTQGVEGTATPDNSPTPTGTDTPTPTPTASGTATASPTSTPVDACGCSANPTGTNTNLKAASVALNAVAYNGTAELFILHDGNGFYCMDALCSHEGVNIGAHSQGSTWSATNAGTGFYCGAHGSKFDKNGAVTHGPANSPLPHYQLAIDASGNFWVDYNITVGATCRC